MELLRIRHACQGRDGAVISVRVAFAGIQTASRNQHHPAARRHPSSTEEGSTRCGLGQGQRRLRRGFGAGFGATGCDDDSPSVLRTRWAVSCLEGVSGAGGTPSARRSPTLRSIRFRPMRRLPCFRLSVKFTPYTIA